MKQTYRFSCRLFNLLDVDRSPNYKPFYGKKNHFTKHEIRLQLEKKLTLEVTHEILNLLNAVSEVNPYDTWRTTALHQTDKSGEKK